LALDASDVAAQRSEGFHIVRSRRKQPRDDGAGRLVLRQRAHEIPVFVKPDGVGRINNHFVIEQVGMLGHNLLKLVEPEREHNRVRVRNCFANGGGSS
jgi:hypothetical protein